MSIIILPRKGFINRLEVIVSAIALSILTGRQIYHMWIPIDPHNQMASSQMVSNKLELADEIDNLSLEDLFEKSIPKYSINCNPDVCFLNSKDSIYQKYFKIDNINYLTNDFTDLYEYLINNPEKNILIETSKPIKIEGIKEKIWNNMLIDIFSKFVPRTIYLEIVENISTIENGVFIDQEQYNDSSADSYFDDIYQWLIKLDKFILLGNNIVLVEKLVNKIKTYNNQIVLYDKLKILGNVHVSQLKLWEQKFIEFLYLAKCKNIYGIFNSNFANLASQFGNKIYKNLFSQKISSCTKIVKALYGIESKCYDVTNIIKNIDVDKYFVVSNDLFGDPFPFRKKFLNIKFLDGSSRAIMEGENVSLTNKSYNNFGFIITRCVKTKLQDIYWQECYRCIRTYYDEEIVIIDDNSDQSLVTTRSLINTRIIISEFPGCGELLPYYYFYKNKFFDKAVILHDSMFIRKNIDFGSIKKFKYLWYFSSELHFLGPKFMEQMKNSSSIINLYHSNSWFGCFGAASVIDYETLSLLQEKYDLFVLLNLIKNREDRMVFERILAVLVFNEKIVSIDNCSIFGDIINHTTPFYFDYTGYVFMDKHMVPIVKVWSGR